VDALWALGAAPGKVLVPGRMRPRGPVREVVGARRLARAGSGVRWHAGMKVEVKAKNGEFRFECNEGEHVLYAGLRQGIDLPYECATGTCGTCKARAVEESPS